MYRLYSSTRCCYLCSFNVERLSHQDVHSGMSHICSDAHLRFNGCVMGKV